jgi:decaprenyl-phosphate phosphoribosyltransferase
VTATTTASPPARGRATALLVSARPQQWTKNAFVLAGVVFAGVWTEPGKVAAALVAFVAFCLVSSATYLFNDAADAAGDRLNPRTAGRPQHAPGRRSRG